MNNIELSSNSNCRNEVYNINNNNNNRNSIANKSRISDSENNSIVTNNVVNRSISENYVSLI